MSDPPRVASPSFWVADLSPSVKELVRDIGMRVREIRTRLESRSGAVSETGDALGGLVEG